MRFAYSATLLLAILFCFAWNVVCQRPQPTPARPRPLPKSTPTTPKGPLPDLAIRDGEVTLDRSKVRLLIENLGDGPAPGSMLAVNSATSKVDSFAPHESRWVEVAASPIKATKVYEAHISSGFAAYEEANYSNNKLYVRNLIEDFYFTFDQYSDVAVVELRKDQSAGKTIIRVRLANLGGKATGPFLLELSSAGQEGPFIKRTDLPIADLPGKTEKWVNFEVSSSTGGGILGGIAQAQLKYQVYADSQKKVLEDKEINNKLILLNATGEYFRPKP